MAGGRLSQLMGGEEPKAPRGMAYVEAREPSAQAKTAYRGALAALLRGDDAGARAQAEAALSSDPMSVESRNMINDMDARSGGSAYQEIFKRGMQALMDGDEKVAENYFRIAADEGIDVAPARRQLERLGLKKGKILIPETSK